MVAQLLKKAGIAHIKASVAWAEAPSWSCVAPLVGNVSSIQPVFTHSRDDRQAPVKILVFSR